MYCCYVRHLDFQYLKNMKNNNEKMKKLFYFICIILTIGSIFLIVVSEEIETVLISIMNLLLFGVGGVCFYVLDKKGNKNIGQEKVITVTDKRGKMIALALACSGFVFAGYLMLPFNHLFDGTRGYTPVLGYIAGIAGILFFGFGLITSIIRLIKPRPVMQISDEGLVISKGIKNQQFIAWKDIEKVTVNKLFLFVYLKNPELYRVNKVLDYLNTKLTGTNINIPLNSINYDIGQIEKLIRNKLDSQKDEKVHSYYADSRNSCRMQQRRQS